MNDDFFLSGSVKRKQPSQSSRPAQRSGPSNSTPSRRGSSSPYGGTRGGSRGGRGGRGGRMAPRSQGGAPPQKLQQRNKRERVEDREDDDANFDDLSDDEEVDHEESTNEEDPHLHENADEKRLRLAQEYLESVKTSSAGDGEVAEKIRQDAKERANKLQYRVASKLAGFTVDEASIRTLKGHAMSVTSVAVDDEETVVFSASKDGTAIKYDLETGKKLWRFLGKRLSKDKKGSKGPIFALALSSDGRFLALGGEDKFVHIYDAQTNAHLESFPGHRGTVSALTFRRNSSQLFSGAFDRTVKVWDIEERSYIETLFGHQTEITDIDSFLKERAVSSGFDHSVRLWKIVEQTQLLFQADGHSIDAVRLLNDDIFVSGNEYGSVSVWNFNRKKPIVTRTFAHGSFIKNDIKYPHWITCLAAFRNSDLFASGSNSGEIILWEFDPVSRQIKRLLAIPCSGYVNSLAFSKSGRYLVAGVGRDHRLGRWNVQPDDVNCVRIIPLMQLI